MRCLIASLKADLRAKATTRKTRGESNYCNANAKIKCISCNSYPDSASDLPTEDPLALTPLTFAFGCSAVYSVVVAKADETEASHCSTMKRRCHWWQVIAAKSERLIVAARASLCVQSRNVALLNLVIRASEGRSGRLLRWQSRERKNND